MIEHIQFVLFLVAALLGGVLVVFCATVVGALVWTVTKDWLGGYFRD